MKESLVREKNLNFDDQVFDVRVATHIDVQKNRVTKPSRFLETLKVFYWSAYNRSPLIVLEIIE